MTVRQHERGTGKPRKPHKAVTRRSAGVPSTITVKVDTIPYVFATESVYQALDFAFIKDKRPQQFIKKITMRGDYR